MLSKEEKKVLSLIDENKEEIVEYLRKLINFKTTTPSDNSRAEGEDYKKLQDFIYNTLNGMGFSLDMWEIDTSKLEDFPGSGISPGRDLSNMPVAVGRLKGGGEGEVVNTKWAL